jgi:hypothetical protein
LHRDDTALQQAGCHPQPNTRTRSSDCTAM